MKTLLHVGCGHNTLRELPAFFQDGDWDEIRYDVDANVRPDIVGTLQDMSLIEDAVMDAVYSSHNIEHVWAFEVQGVLAQLLRVLRPDGFLVVMCPDVAQVAQAIAEGHLEDTLYQSPAGPITAMDILYGFQSDIRAGNEFMAHKTAFTGDTLAGHLLRAGFASVVVHRMHACGLQALATVAPVKAQMAEQMAQATVLQPELIFEGRTYGRFDVR